MKYLQHSPFENDKSSLICIEMGKGMRKLDFLLKSGASPASRRGRG